MIELIKRFFYFILFVIALAGNNHPEPPAIPNVQAIYDHEKITIYRLNHDHNISVSRE